ncbi:MAG TPA: ABC transporter ATP-binding protein [Haploplasma sp.]|nr:ABC transporter ATP-binding protein [Haploplasma sp.]
MSKKTPTNMKRFSKANDFKGTMLKLNVYLKPYYFKIAISALLSVIGSLLTVLGPYMIGLITTHVTDGLADGIPILSTNIKLFGLSLSMAGIAIAIVFVYIFASLFNYLQNFLLIGMTQSLTYGMRKDLTEKINRLPLRYFDSEPFGDVLSKVTNDVETINMTLNQSLSEIFRGITLILSIIIIMFILNWILALIVLTTTLLSFLAARFFVKKSQGYFRVQAKYYGDLNGHIEEIYSGHNVVKVFDYQDTAKEQFSTINDELFESALKSQFISGIMMPVQFFFSNIAYVLVVLVGALLYISSGMDIGLIPTFFQYTRQINQPVQSVGNIANVLQQTAAAAERVFSLLDEEEEKPERSNLVKLDNIKGDVSFKDVYFNYLPEVPVIRGFSAEVKAGQTVAIVGPTGAGKTTMVNLLMRFYDIDRGKISIDNIDTLDMSKDDVRSLFAMVLQDTWLFEGTILENLTYGTNATLEDVKKAAKSSQVDHFIESLAGSYNFKLSESGTNISQGQRQLLTICRAMIKNSPMLILDEATSNVDTRTEILIQEAMENLMNGRTSFVIAHRLSTIKNADVIFVMKDGNIIETGTHNELIDQKGFYSKLYLSQFEN